jgi:multidrug efflux pump subunit AcrA (membrane-fusion protein)
LQATLSPQVINQTYTILINYDIIIPIFTFENRIQIQEHIPMNKMLVTSALIASTALVGFTLVSHEADAEDQTAQAAQQTPSYQTITVTSSAVGGSIVLGGSVLPVKTVNLSAQMPGDVKYIAGQEGDQFKEGDLLVSLDTAALLAKREQALTQLSSAEAGFRNAQIQYQREILSPNSQANQMMGGAPSMFSFFSDPFRSFTGEGSPGFERHSNLYQYGVGVQTAQNQVEQARAAIRELDENIVNANSYVKKMIEEGDIVQPGMPLVTFSDINKLQIQIEVPTNLIDMISTGQQLKARLDGSDQLVDVAVDRIYPSADATGHTTTVKFSLSSTEGARSGMYAEVMIPDPSKSGNPTPIVPQSAIVWRGSLPAVFKVTEDGQIKLRLLRIGERTGDGKVVVISGISAGDTILANPSAGSR